MAEPGPAQDLSHWWAAEEFEPCPMCGEAQLAPPSPSLDGSGLRVCLTCGVVPEPEPG